MITPYHYTLSAHFTSSKKTSSLNPKRFTEYQQLATTPALLLDSAGQAIPTIGSNSRNAIRIYKSMTSLPASSLVETVANKIKQMILSGSLVNILPGERELGHRLSVGRETIRKALALLERDAWIAPPRIKVPRRILKTTEEETVKNIFCHPVQEKKEILGFSDAPTPQKAGIKAYWRRYIPSPKFWRKTASASVSLKLPGS